MTTLTSKRWSFVYEMSPSNANVWVGAKLGIDEVTCLRTTIVPDVGGGVT